MITGSKPQPFRICVLRFSKRKKKRRVFCLLVCSPDDHNSQGGARPKRGGRDVRKLCHVADRSVTAQATFYSSPEHSRWELSQEWAARTPTGTRAGGQSPKQQRCRPSACAWPERVTGLTRNVGLPVFGTESGEGN